MKAKVIKIGSSVGITIPQAIVREQNLRTGDVIEMSIKRANKLSKEDQDIARLTAQFINRYRSDLEALAK
jgi:antitoxin component of MazEF toxin-antitoxin module